MTYPPIEPFETGMLDVGDGTWLFWEISGNPRGRPALYLHGGPGSGLGAAGGYRRRFDPEKYLIVGLDQRGCGRSTPLVIDALDGLATLTTATLVDDLEALRRHLGIERWLVSGMSWGTTLALAYAVEHPERVGELVLGAVTTTSRAEVEWITEGVGRLFPEAWERFDAQSGRRSGERVVEAYARRLAGRDADDREAAARDWDDWENTHVSLDPNWQPGPLHVDPVQRRTFATLVTHFWAHDAFMTAGDALLARVGELASYGGTGIPAVLVHGRRDVSGPAITPWLLHSQWPASELIVIEAEGHGGPLITQAMTEAADRFAAR